MAEIVWDVLEERFVDQGVDHGVLYDYEDGAYVNGVAWNGLVTVTQSPSGAEPNKQYADNIVYVNLLSAEEFAATIECFMAPEKFDRYNGVAKTASGLRIAQQNRPAFGFSWRTGRGTAADPDSGYVINIAYGCQASPSEKAHTTKNDSPEPVTFSFALSTTPVSVAGYKPTAFVSIDSNDPDIDPDNLADLEDILYGTAGVEPRLPLPAEIDSILGTGITLVNPTDLVYDSGTHTITYAPQTGVVYRRTDTGAPVTANVILTVGQKLVVKKEPAAGYNFNGVFVDDTLYSY